MARGLAQTPGFTSVPDYPCRASLHVAPEGFAWEDGGRGPLSPTLNITMKTFACILVTVSILAGCVAYAPQSGPAPKGGAGNNYCPPGQAKKGNC